MAAFQERAHRLDLSFPLEFVSTEGEAAGHCLNISGSGLLAIFSAPPELWTEGTVFLHFGDNACSIHARIARTDGREAGLTFAYRSEADRHAIQAILAFAAAHSHLVGLPPF